MIRVCVGSDVEQCKYSSVFRLSILFTLRSINAVSRQVCKESVDQQICVPELEMVSVRVY